MPARRAFALAQTPLTEAPFNKFVAPSSGVGVANSVRINYCNCCSVGLITKYVVPLARREGGGGGGGEEEEEEERSLIKDLKRCAQLAFA